jgi:hypothetical protein
MGISLGLANDLDEGELLGAVRDLLGDAPLRQQMAASGRMNLDGRGAARIAARIRLLDDERLEALSDPVTLPKVAVA